MTKDSVLESREKIRRLRSLNLLKPHALAMANAARTAAAHHRLIQMAERKGDDQEVEEQKPLLAKQLAQFDKAHAAYKEEWKRHRKRGHYSSAVLGQHVRRSKRLIDKIRGTKEDDQNNAEGHPLSGPQDAELAANAQHRFAFRRSTRKTRAEQRRVSRSIPKPPKPKVQPMNKPIQDTASRNPSISELAAFKGLSPKEQKAYLKEHPNSKFAPAGGKDRIDHHMNQAASYAKKASAAHKEFLKDFDDTSKINSFVKPSKRANFHIKEALKHYGTQKPSADHAKIIRAVKNKHAHFMQWDGHQNSSGAA